MSPRALIAGGAVALWLASCAGSAWLGWDYRAGKAAQEQLDTAIAYAGQIRAEQDTAHKLAADIATARAAQAPQDRIITKEITRYVQVTPPAQRCVLPGTWRVRHDAAATGIPAPAEAGPLDAADAAPVEDAAALDTVGDNYAAARECRSKLKDWIDRYHTLEAPRAEAAP